MKKRDTIFLAFLLVIGFAAVTSSLIINGNINLSFDDEFTKNVVFTEANTKEGTATISTNEQIINFESRTLEFVSEEAILDFTVANKSREYDASVTINCGLKDSFSDFNEYLDIIVNLTNPFDLAAGASKKGKLTIRLAKAYTESIASLEFSCTLTATPLERESIGNRYKIPYKETALNGANPVIEDNLVPVTIASNGEVTKADIESEWYNYENKEWANAVILVDTPSQIYNVSDTIKESDIESYFVWIPRYRYQIFDEGNYTGVEPKLTESIAKEIQIEFESRYQEPSTGNKEGEWLTHPAFTNYDTAGIWVGKFETGYKDATTTNEAGEDTIDTTKVIIKPNSYAWNSLPVSKMFYNSYQYLPDLNSHMMRNTEWGAVAYLSHSKYGINTEIRINNNSTGLTGYAANTQDAAASQTANQPYNTETGYLASTTGNITGIYDMSGGSWEYVAGYVKNAPATSGFTQTELNNYSAYFDIYPSDSLIYSYNNRILGDATGEMGPFTSGYLNNWYDDNAIFIEPASSWPLRGGYYGSGRSAGQFHFHRDTGVGYLTFGFRIVLVF